MKKLATITFLISSPLWAMFHTFQEGQNLESIAHKYDILPAKLQKILRTDRLPLVAGDRIYMTETETPEGHSYPQKIFLNYKDPTKKDLQLVGDLVPNDRPWRYTIEFFDDSDRLKTVIWNNKKQETLFDFENFTYTDIEITPGGTLIDAQPRFKTNAHIVRWLISNKRGEKLTLGDMVSIKETSFSLKDDVVEHIQEVTVDFADPDKEDIHLTGELLSPSRDKSYRYTVNFYNEKRVHKRTLYLNRRNPFNTYYVEFHNERGVFFPLGGTFENWMNQISAGYRVIKNPTPNRGGPATYFHRAIDYSIDKGTPLYAPYDGIAMASFVIKDATPLPKDEAQAILNSESYGRVISVNFDYPTGYSSTRGLETERIKIILAHLSRIEEKLGNDMITTRLENKVKAGEITSHIQKEKSRRWYEAVAFSQDDDANVKQMIEYNNWYLKYQGVKYTEQLLFDQEVHQGQLIGYSGNTGRSTGPHVHLEVFIDGNYVNPINFFRDYGEN